MTSQAKVEPIVKPIIKLLAKIYQNKNVIYAQSKTNTIKIKVKSGQVIPVLLSIHSDAKKNNININISEDESDKIICIDD